MRSLVRIISLQTAALLFGAGFVAIGVLGFVPGITTDYDTMTFAGHDSEARVLGLFQVNVLHSLVHLLFGVAGLAAARSRDASRLYLVGGGALYLLLWIYGVAIDLDGSANFVALNEAVNWLHLLTVVGMVGGGVLLSRTPPRPDAVATEG